MYKSDCKITDSSWIKLKAINMYINTRQGVVWLDYNVVRPATEGDYFVKLCNSDRTLTSKFNGTSFIDVNDDDVTYFYSDKYLQDVPDMKEWLEIR